jgi:hypothetical protein
MTALGFENYCADILRRQGWAARTTSRSGDQGVDVLADRAGVRVVLQCKFYSQAVGNKAVQEAFAAKAYASANFAAVVTNARFTNSAIKLGKATGTYLLHVSELESANHLFGFSSHGFNSFTPGYRVLRACPGCKIRLRLPAAKSGTVCCPDCSVRFFAST